ncbi:hypothetical protein Aph01nite_43730 [Acrocarpospora phusangensis]|uniref:Uncharacterized protein n=1 Tax=Acrocarpospora phusangensis TaxID=1070424 RepID=A0A919QCB9_9ACTN|nr:hypothetical protein [Acrocarpospora phusangensis]GIH26063.1 hypothetical protein Aph01nite_43730 [Acrocarpospora phusangensis]
MATGSIPLLIAAATPPDGTTNNAAPSTQRVKTSASAPTPYFLQAAFDATTKEQLTWSWRMPANYASGLTVKVTYKMASATTGGVVIEARVAAISPGDATDADAKAFGSANTSSTSTVPGTAGHEAEISLAVANNDSLAPGDHVVFYLARDPGAGGDTAAGDMEIVAVSLDYTTT